jgi:hypothetical protein
LRFSSLRRKQPPFENLFAVHRAIMYGFSEALAFPQARLKRDEISTCRTSDAIVASGAPCAALRCCRADTGPRGLQPLRLVGDRASNPEIAYRADRFRIRKRHAGRSAPCAMFRTAMF